MLPSGSTAKPPCEPSCELAVHSMSPGCIESAVGLSQLPALQVAAVAQGSQPSEQGTPSGTGVPVQAPARHTVAVWQLSVEAQGVPSGTCEVTQPRRGSQLLA